MRPFCVWCILSALAGNAFAQADRKATLDEMLRLLRPSRTPVNGRINAFDKTWEDWVRRTGELPPDFDRMPSIPGLPDPLRMADGSLVTTPSQWTRQKQYLRDQVQHWIFGKFPPNPTNLRAVVTKEERQGRVTVRFVRLEFGPGHKATLRLELVIPDGKGPFPVFLTNHARNRPWIYTAVRRGYIAAVYHATDPNYGNGDDSDAWIDIYPEYDFSCLARWAWAASRAVDYLVKLPEVDKRKIGLSGHSRNGKQALLAAAFDERIGAVIPSSGNSGECDPWRFTTEPFANESIELLAGAQSHWFHPRLRFFSGREDKLPVDQNTLLALVAPRGLMMYTGFAESASNPVGFEQAYRDTLRVYRMLHKEENAWLHLREGEHDTTSGDIENFVDFYDAIFDRRPQSKTETFIHGYDYEEWKKRSGESIDPRTFRLADNSPRKRIEWALGEEPPGAPNYPRAALPANPMVSEGALAAMFKRPTEDRAAMARVEQEGMKLKVLPFGDGLAGQLFLPANAQGKVPVVIWLHAYSYQYGWSIANPWTSTGSDIRLDQRPSFPSLVRRGFAVLAFDQIGFGTRVKDAKDFYRRYPHWSLMGKMVADTRAAVDALAALDVVDKDRIYLMGYSLGAKIGLLAAALEPRVRGVAAVSGFDPLRLSLPDRGVEGIRHYSHIHGLMPRLGFFEGQESKLPFDFDAALQLIAPRRLLVIAPSLDRYARVADVRTAVEPVRKAWQGHETNLVFETPLDFNRFYRKTQERVFDWLAAQ